MDVIEDFARICTKIFRFYFVHGREVKRRLTGNCYLNTDSIRIRLIDES